MAGIEGRVKGFLSNWSKVKEHLEEVLKDGDTGMVELKGGLQAFENVPPDSLQTLEGEIPAAGTSFEGDVEVQP